MNVSEKKKNLQYLSESQIPCSDLYGNWLKKIPWAEVDIIFENSFDTNSKIQLYNKKGKWNSKIAFAFENSIETKIKIRDFFSIKKTKIK